MFRKLLVPLDRSPLAEQALGAAAAIARVSDADMDVVLVHQPLPGAGFVDAAWIEAELKDEDAYLESTVAELASGASVVATHALLRGDPVEMICARAHDVGADLVVMTSHGRTGLSRAWLGSIADGVVRRSAIPVLVLRPLRRRTGRTAPHRLFKHLLVPLDGSALAMEILGPASALARCSNARIALVRVVQPVPLIVPGDGMALPYPPLVQDDVATARLADEAEEQIAGVAASLTKQGDDVETDVVVADLVALAILDFAREHHVDGIAMSTHGRGASRLLVGSVADKLLRASGLPVLLQHPAGA